MVLPGRTIDESSHLASRKEHSIPHDSDGYPLFTHKDLEWFYAEVSGLATQYPNDVTNVARRKAGLDLELVIYVRPRSRDIFTEAVCEDLARKAGERAEGTKPLVYVYGDPYPNARSLLEVARQV